MADGFWKNIIVYFFFRKKKYIFKKHIYRVDVTTFRCARLLVIHIYCIHNLSTAHLVGRIDVCGVYTFFLFNETALTPAGTRGVYDERIR